MNMMVSLFNQLVSGLVSLSGHLCVALVCCYSCCLSVRALLQQSNVTVPGLNIPQALETKEDLLSLQKKVKAYVQKAEAYLKCNEEEQSIVGSSDAEDKENKAIILHRYYNNTVDEMHYTADSFNKLVKAYKAAGAKPD